MLNKIVNIYRNRQIVKKLYIKIRYANNHIQQTGKNCYEFNVNDFVTIPLYIKNRAPLSPDIGIISFDYITSSRLWRIDFVIGKSIMIPFRKVKVSEKWQTISIDISKYNEAIRHSISRPKEMSVGLNIIPVHTSSAIRFKIKNICLRPYNKDEAVKHSIRMVYKKRIQIPHIHPEIYLNSDFPCKITVVRASDTEIAVSGTTCQADRDFYMIEIPVFSEFAPKEFHKTGKIQSDHNASFIINIPRKTTLYGASYDRIYSRWAIAVKTEDGYSLSSFARYADSLQSIYSIPLLTPKNKKGIGGFKMNKYEADLDKLEISCITINIHLNDFIGTTPDNTNASFKYSDMTYYVDNEKIRKYDAALLAAAKRNIMVYAVIMIYPENNSRDKTAGRIPEHPEYDDSGAYAMPDLTNLESVNLYAAAIDFLASRYSRPDKQFGHIHRWIVQNEVDAAWRGYDAGKKIAIDLMELYVKSMRLIYYTTLYYNSHTEVFISQAHNRQTLFDANSYPDVKMLDLLLKYSHAEGDFRWGVACYPHSEELMDTKLWLDSDVTNERNINLVTFKNMVHF
jgi:hypothetical protein